MERNFEIKVPLNEYNWYADKAVKVSPKIVPDTICHSMIEPFYSDILVEKAFQDKNYFDLIIGKKNTPKVIYRCINGQFLNENFVPVLQSSDFSICESELICKPSLESGGR